MQSTNRPGKFLVPFAQNDSARVELPATTADATRASQSLGFPPATGLPPEAGGVPPQLEDMNGGLNQISRGVWWALGGGRYPFDSTWANDALIGGYARGAVVPAALGAGQIGLGDWYNNTEANTANPDTDGTGWVPGYQYGATALTGQTGGTVTLTPAQAAKRVITVAGTLTSNLVLVVPTWVYDWTVYNNTGGAFTVTIKNAATSGAIVPQNGAPTPIRCDGTTCFGWSPNIAAATSATQPLQLGQATGRLIRTTVFTRNASNVQVVAVDGGAPTTTGAGTFTPAASTTRVSVKMVGGGGGGGGTPTTDASTRAAGAGGAGGSYAAALYSTPTTQTVTVGAAGVGSAGANGTAGGASTFGALLTAPGGLGGNVFTAATSVGAAAGTQGRPGLSGSGSNLLIATAGQPGGSPFIFGSSGTQVSGQGGTSQLGAGGGNTFDTAGDQASGPGGGGGGAATGPGNVAARAGGSGNAGIILIEEYA